MAAQEELKELFQAMQGRFDPKKAEGINAVVQFDLTGEGAAPFWIRIADGAFDYAQGTAENPKMTLVASVDDFIGVMTGRTSPMSAFMSGRIKVKGDTSLAMKLMPLING
jgi:putative sterol carrier protein